MTWLLRHSYYYKLLFSFLIHNNNKHSIKKKHILLNILFHMRKDVIIIIIILNNCYSNEREQIKCRGSRNPILIRKRKRKVGVVLSGSLLYRSEYRSTFSHRCASHRRLSRAASRPGGSCNGQGRCLTGLGRGKKPRQRTHSRSSASEL